jgi:D-alanyl-D-alanine carboxypeptidase (penicillin-binding protein 5/6)
MAPASMSKLMTLYIIFEKLQDGTLSLDDKFTVSENAWRKGGAASGSSTMFLNIGEQVAVEDLIKGIIIQSGNDACIVAAENIAGSEEDFADLMNETAEKIGLKNSSFANSTGWPHPDQKMSVEDLAILAKNIIQKHGEYYHIFSEKQFTHNGIKQGNRNPLLYSMEGADGLKTGHTDEAGFCLTASAARNGRRLIEVMSGMNSNKERADESERLMNYGFREFGNYKILNKGDVMAEIPVWYGADKTVKAVVSDDVLQTMRRNQRKKYSMKVVYDEPLKAPIKKGDVVAHAEVTDSQGQTDSYNLVADHDVKTMGLAGRFAANLKYLLFGSK